MLTLVMVLTAAFAMPETVNAAAKTKTPAKPKFSSVKVNGNDITLKWKKAKYAKYYRVYVQTGDSEWKYWKKVKKTSANKKKYTNKMKYKVKASGKKYKVYKLVNKYKIAVKKTKKLTYTYHGKPGTKYHFILKAINGKKLSKASLTKTATTPEEPAPSDGDQPGPDDPGDQTDPSEQGPYTITYVLNGRTNDPGNPDAYTTGTEVRLAAPTKEGSDFWGWYTDASFKNKIDVIPAEQKGNLTLYAKWAREAINVEGEGMEDMIWTWWHYPQILTEGDKTFWGYATKEGYCGIAMFDASTGKTVKTNLKLADTVDDHNGITFTILKDKRIMCIYAGGHNSDNELHVRISDEPLDISSFSTDILLDSVGKTCYGQIVESRGRYWVFYRINNTSWGCRSSEDGINWSIERVLVKASMQYYCKFVPTTNDGLVRMLMYSNPTQTAPEIRMGFLNTRNGYMYNSDAKTLIGSDSLDYKEFDVIQDVEKGKTQRLLDAAVSDPDKPKFLIASFSATKASNDSVYYVCDSGKKIKVCDGGKPLWDPKYQLGATFVGDNMIVAARHENLVDRVELYDYDGSAVSLNRTIFTNQITNSVRSARPIADPTGKVLAWHYGYYNIDKYTDYDTSAILYFIDENMLVGAPEQTEPAQTEYKITYVLNGGTNNEENPATYIPGTYTELKAPVREGYEFAGWYADSTFQTNISAITEHVSGDFTLYAKWESEAQYVEDAKTTDMIWGSWMSPHAVSDGNKIFWAYSTKEGTAGVAVYNGDTGKISRTTLQYLYENKPKESYTPAITLTDDKRVVVAVSTEPQARKMIRVYVSEKPLDISKFDSIQVPTTRIVSNCQLVKAGGSYYLFYRGENGLWFYKNSEDCTAWSSETVAIMAKKDTSGQYNYFCRFRPTTDSRLIRIVMQAVPGEDIPTDIRMGFLNTADGLIYNADSFTPLGNEKIDYSNFNIIQSADTGKALNLLDVAVTSPNAPKFIYTSFTDEKGKNDSKYILYNAGRKYDICDGGKDLSDPGLQLGAAFLGSDKIAAARSSDGKDIVELYTVSNSAVTFEKEAYSIDSSDGTRTGRPIADQNGKAVIWHQGTYTSGTVFNTAAVLYLTDSETVVGEPELPVEYKITYELNGGTNSTQNPAAYMSGTAVTLRKPSREGYSFEGWFEDAEFSKAFSGITADTTGDITVYAKWEELPPAVQSTITYELNGGTNSFVNPKTYTIEDKVVLQPPTRVGYTFAGWTFEGQETPVLEVIVEAGSIGDRTYTANWTANTYEVTMDAAGGTVSESTVTVTFDQEVTLPDPTREGYTFIGWYSGEVKYESGIWNTAFDVALTAQWKANQYTVTFEDTKKDPITVTYVYNDGITENTVVTLQHDQTVPYPAVPAQSGYLFAGWYTDSSLYNRYSFDGELNESITLYAKWINPWYSYESTISPEQRRFLYVNGTDIGYLAFVAQVDETITINATGKSALRVDLYDSNLNMQTYDSGLTNHSISYHVTAGQLYYIGVRFISSISAGNITVNLYGTVADSSAVVKIPDSATHYIPDSSATMTVTFDEAFTLPILTRRGYTFNGWFNGETQVTEGTWTTSSDMTLTPHWTPVTHVVTLDANGGETEFESINVTYDATYVLPTPERTGYTFDGWWYGGNIRYEDGLWNNVEDLTLVARWVPNVYNVTLQDYTKPIADITIRYNDGETDDLVIHLGSGCTLPYPIAPEREGYVFGGWYTDEELQYRHYFDSHIYDDMTLYARWIEPDQAYDGIITVGSTTTVALSGQTVKYYAIVSEVSTWANIYSTGAVDTEGYVYDANLNEQYHGQDGGDGSNFHMEAWLEAGQLYYIAIKANEDTTNENVSLVITGNRPGSSTVAYPSGDVDGYVPGSSFVVSMVYDQSFLLPTPNRTGYTFTGWYNGEE